MVLGQDIERAEYQDDDTERDALLSNSPKTEEPGDIQSKRRFFSCQRTFGWLHLLLAFVGGVIACLVAQYALHCLPCRPSTSTSSTNAQVLAPPFVGSTERHPFPPSSPTNAFPSLFPSNVGYPGDTPTGAEPGLVATAPAYPVHSGAAQLILPSVIGGSSVGTNRTFDLLRKWGNLSPWFSVDRTAFGLDAHPEPPETCRVTGLHLLHRHGARYPTAYGESTATPQDMDAQ